MMNRRNFIKLIASLPPIAGSLVTKTESKPGFGNPPRTFDTDHIRSVWAKAKQHNDWAQCYIYKHDPKKTNNIRGKIEQVERKEYGVDGKLRIWIKGEEQGTGSIQTYTIA